MSGWTWNYRVILHSETTPPRWGLHEVYYARSGEPDGWTDAASAYADAEEGPEGIAKELAMMLNDAMRLPPLMARGDKLVPWRPEDRALGACASSGEAARTAVEATKRRYEAMQHCMCYSCQMERYGGVVHTKTDALACPKLKRAEPPLEADDSRVTDGHKCCGGKPDCGCAGQ